jgi:PAS domain S-box-containing protein
VDGDGVADLFDAFMGASVVVSWMKNAAGEYVYANHALASAYGRTPEQLIGMTASQLIGSKLAAAADEADARVLATGVPSVEVVSTKLLDGRVWQIARFVVRDAHGNPCIAGVGVDITAQHAAETLAGPLDQLQHAQTRCDPQRQS